MLGGAKQQEAVELSLLGVHKKRRHEALSGVR